MKKNIFYKVFKVGAIPAELSQTLKQETIIEFDEGCRVTVTYHKFRTKGKYFFYRKTGFLGFLIVTKKRVLGYAFNKRFINFDATFTDYEISLKKENCLLFRFQAADVIPNSSGIIEIRYVTQKAIEILKAIKQYHTESNS